MTPEEKTVLEKAKAWAEARGPFVSVGNAEHFAMLVRAHEAALDWAADDLAVAVAVHEERSAKRMGFRINGSEPHPGSLRVDVPVDLLHSYGPRPDRAWSFRDASGHFHAYSVTDSAYPTLFELTHTCASEHLDGDGWWCECRTEYQCRICQETITPGMIAGPHTDQHGGPRHWEVDLDLETPTIPSWTVGAMVTVETTEAFGMAVVSSMNVQTFGDLVNVKVTLVGAGQLGKRGKR